MTKKLLTCAEKWSRKRNWLKFRLMGLTTALKDLSKNKALTASERDHIRRIIPRADTFLANWDVNNDRSKMEYCRD